jgi:hypothetical protein
MIYKIEFFIPAKHGKKYISAINDWLAQFVADHNSLQTANSLLTGINNVLNGQQSSWVGISQGLQVAYVKSDQTKIYQDLAEWENNPNITPDFSLPTTGLKVIVEAWCNYLR